MFAKSPCLVVVALLAAGFPAAGAMAQDNENQSLGDALTSGDANLVLRYRYEFVDQDFNRANGNPFTKNANASTLLVRLNYKTGSWNDWSGFGEFDYVGELLMRDFNNTVDPNRNQYPVVADPWGSDLNQLYLDYDGLADSKVRLGRQRIILDNQRFVGGVGWRQNEQTYDAAAGTFKGIPNTELFVSYVRQVNRIFGERSAVGKDLSKTLLLNAKISLADGWSVVPYGYYIDSDSVAAFDTATYGARLSGKIPAGEGSISLIGELATQSDIKDNPVSYRASYYHFDLLWALTNGLSFGVGFESLGGDQNVSGASFRTPLATLHAFQGWADQFLATPGAGIDDKYAKLVYKYDKWSFLGVYHDFSAASGSASFGSEFDVSASRSISDRYALLLKAAFFSADNTSFSDVTKFWLMLTARY